MLCSKTANKREHFIGQTIAIVRAIGRFSIILNKRSIPKMVHSLLSKSLSAIFRIGNAIVFLRIRYNIVNANPTIYGTRPFIIFFYICHSQKNITAQIRLLLSWHLQFF